MSFNRSITEPGPGILAMILVTLFTSSINAQQSRKELEQPPPQTSNPGSGNSSVLTSSNKDYRISAGDVLHIEIERAPELSHHYPVNASGIIEMPVLGLVKAERMTTYELARVIAKGLREQEYLNNPNVVITVTQFYRHKIFIQGAVRQPNLYQVEDRPTLLTMIGLAGGLTENHGSTVFILRPGKKQKQATDDQIPNLQNQMKGETQIQTPDASQTAQSQPDDSDSAPAGDYELIRVNLGALYKGQFDQNQRLEPGDIINIPRADVFFVAGEVEAPGSFPLKEGTTLRQAISLAQGMTFKAKSSQGVIFREEPLLGSRQEIKVDIGAVMSGKKEDIPVLANDVIIVPNSRTKSIGGTLLMAFGVNAARLPIRY
jgi:polysaccharide biosynthesis/export protein